MGHPSSFRFCICKSSCSLNYICGAYITVYKAFNVFGEYVPCVEHLNEPVTMFLTRVKEGSEELSYLSLEVVNKGPFHDLRNTKIPCLFVLSGFYIVPSLVVVC